MTITITMLISVSSIGCVMYGTVYCQNHNCPAFSAKLIVNDSYADFFLCLFDIIIDEVNWNSGCILKYIKKMKF